MHSLRGLARERLQRGIRSVDWRANRFRAAIGRGLADITLKQGDFALGDLRDRVFPFALGGALLEAHRDEAKRYRWLSTKYKTNPRTRPNVNAKARPG